MASPQTTPLSQLLGKDDNRIQMPPNPNPTGQFGDLPARPMTGLVTNQLPGGVGQGMSMPEGSTRKEFFGSLKDFDYKTVILVFAIILILSSGMFASGIKPYVGSAVGSDGKTTLIGSLIAAIVGTLLFIIVRAVGRF